MRFRWFYEGLCTNLAFNVKKERMIQGTHTGVKGVQKNLCELRMVCMGIFLSPGRVETCLVWSKVFNPIVSEYMGVGPTLKQEEQQEYTYSCYCIKIVDLCKEQ